MSTAPAWLTLKELIFQKKNILEKLLIMYFVPEEEFFFHAFHAFRSGKYKKKL